MRADNVLRYRIPALGWVLPALPGVALLLGTAWAVAENVGLAARSGRFPQGLGIELSFSFAYAVSTTAVQMALGTALAVFSYIHLRGKTEAWFEIAVFLPYFCSIILLARAVNRVAVADGLQLESWRGWMLSVGLSVWQFVPFVFLLALEELKSINPRSRTALVAEGGTTADFLRYLIRPALRGILADVALLRFLWMLTKVDVLYAVLGAGPGLGARFCQVQIFEEVHGGGVAGSAAQRATAMMGLAVGVVLSHSLLRRLVTPTRSPEGRTPSLGPFAPSDPSPLNARMATPAIARSPKHASRPSWRTRFPLATWCGLAIALAMNLPILLQASWAVVPNSVLLHVSADELGTAWSQFAAPESLRNVVVLSPPSGTAPAYLALRWLLQTTLLAAAAAWFYTFLGGATALLLLREPRLAWLGCTHRLRWVPVLAYSIPIISIAVPTVNWLNSLPAEGTVAAYCKYVLALGFYVWPFCTWASFSVLKKLEPRGELAAVVEGAGLLQAVRLSLLPAARGGMLAVLVVTFAICFNEFIFGMLLLNRSAEQTLPVALFNALTTVADGGAVAPLLVLGAVSIVAAAVFAGLLRFALQLDERRIG